MACFLCRFHLRILCALRRRRIFSRMYAVSLVADFHAADGFGVGRRYLLPSGGGVNQQVIGSNSLDPTLESMSVSMSLLCWMASYCLFRYTPTLLRGMHSGGERGCVSRFPPVPLLCFACGVWRQVSVGGNILEMSCSFLVLCCSSSEASRSVFDGASPKNRVSTAVLLFKWWGILTTQA